MTDRLFYALTASFGAGILLQSLYTFSRGLIFFVIFISAVLVLHALVAEKEKRNRLIIYSALCLLVFSLGSLRVFVHTVLYAPTLDEHIETSVTFEGAVLDEPNTGTASTRFILRADTVDVDSKRHDISRNKILVVGNAHERVRYGERVKVSGTLKKPENFSGDDGGVAFDYVTYLAKDDIFYEMIRPQIQSLGAARGMFVALQRRLFSVKNAFLAHLKQMLPEPHASLAGGLLLGAKQSLGDDWQERFQRAGVIHIVVLSGYNITLVADFFMKLFAFVSLRKRLIGSAVAISFFALMVGAGATVVRASIMALLVIVARATGNTYDVKRALFIAGVIMILIHPALLAYDRSFELSFLATFGLVYLSPFFERRLQWMPERFHMRDILTTTIATQVMVLPLLLYAIGGVSIISLLTNMLILIAIPATMLASFIAGALHFILPLLATPFSFLAYLLLAYELFIVRIFAALPFALIKVGSFPSWALALSYALYGVGLAYIFRNNKIVLSKEGKKTSS